jgi:hypothetical protein
MHRLITRGSLVALGSARAAGAGTTPDVIRAASRLLSRAALPIGTATVVGGALIAGGLALAGPAGAQSTPACPAPVITGTTATVTCSYTGAAQYWTVPTGVGQATFTLYGAEGGTDEDDGPGGLGAQVTGSLLLAAGTVLQVNVGQGGAINGGSPFGGGGSPGDDGASGGGASDIRDGSYGLADRLLVAAGGGGGGQIGISSDSSAGGAGGNSGAAGGQGSSITGGCGETLTGGSGGQPGTASAGGSGGAAGADSPSCGDTETDNGANGSEGTGGAGGEFDGGGGGGGGYYGGGGGGAAYYDTDTDKAGSGGGGGGSSYTGTATGASVTDGVAAPAGSPNGEVIITYSLPVPSVITAGLPAGSVGRAYSATLGASGGVAPYTWSVPAASLPAGLSLDQSNGVIAGRPKTPGVFKFRVEVTDSDVPAESSTRKLSITIRPLITKITPDHAVRAGGTTVTIKGAGLACPAAATSCVVTVHFGSHQATVQTSASGTLVVKAPAGRGTVDVTVTVAGATSAITRADRFYYRR